MGEQGTKRRGEMTDGKRFPPERRRNISNSNGTGEGGRGSQWGEGCRELRTKCVWRPGGSGGEIWGYLHRHGLNLISINEWGTRALLCLCCSGSCCLVWQCLRCMSWRAELQHTYFCLQRKMHLIICEVALDVFLEKLQHQIMFVFPLLQMLLQKWKVNPECGELMMLTDSGSHKKLDGCVNH